VSLSQSGGKTLIGVCVHSYRLEFKNRVKISGSQFRGKNGRNLGPIQKGAAGKRLGWRLELVPKKKEGNSEG